MPTTLITGVSRGIGLAIARDLAEHGHDIVGFSRSTPGAGFDGVHIPVDLSNPDDTARALSQVTADFHIDNLVNNAGIVENGGIETVTPARIQQVMAINVNAMFSCCQAVLPAMRAAGRGRIVNIGSRSADGKEGVTVYSASKAAVTGLTRSLALEVGRDGITVNCIAPGPIATEMLATQLPPGSAAEKAVIDNVPVGRLGTVEDIAATVRFFISDEAGFITGQQLFVCGGFSVGGRSLPPNVE